MFIVTFRVDILENGDKIIKHSLWLFNLNRFSKKKKKREREKGRSDDLYLVKIMAALG